MNKIKAKLKDKKSFTYMAYKVSKSKLFSAGLRFISSIIIIRHLPKEDFGLYILMIAFFAIFENIMNGFDSSLVRFIPTSGKSKQHKLIASVLSIKTIITVFMLIIIYFLYHYSYQWLNIQVEKLNDYNKLYIIISIGIIFSYVLTITRTLLTSFLMYDILFKLSIIQGILIISNSIFIWQFSYGVVEYVLVGTIISFILALINLYYVYGSKKFSFKEVKSSINIMDIKQTFVSQIWLYSTPLLGVSWVSYIRKYLPTYILGTMVSLETLAVYSIFQQITEFLHKGYASFIQGLYPKLFQMMQSKSKAIDKLFWIGLSLRLLVFIVLYFGYDLILSLYNIKESEMDSLVFIVLISVFLVMYFATFYDLIIMSSKNTTPIFYSSIIRNLIMVPLAIILFLFYNVIGLVCSVYINAILMVYGLKYFADKRTSRNTQKDLIVFIITIICFTLIVHEM